MRLINTLVKNCYYHFHCNTETQTTHLQDRSTSPVFRHHCHRPTGTSAGNHTLSAADNCRFQATCQFRCVVALSHWRSPHNASVRLRYNAYGHTRYDTSLRINELIAVSNASFTSNSEERLRHSHVQDSQYVVKPFVVRASMHLPSVVITLIDPCDQLVHLRHSKDVAKHEPEQQSIVRSTCRDKNKCKCPVVLVCFLRSKYYCL